MELCIKLAHTLNTSTPREFSEWQLPRYVKNTTTHRDIKLPFVTKTLHETYSPKSSYQSHATSHATCHTTKTPQKKTPQISSLNNENTRENVTE